MGNIILTRNEGGLNDALHCGHSPWRRHVTREGDHVGVEETKRKAVQKVDGNEEPRLPHHRVQEHSQRHGCQGDDEGHDAAQLLDHNSCEKKKLSINSYMPAGI